jgi:transposase-like protein
MKGFPGLLEFTRNFGDDDACHEYLRLARWNDGYECSRCGETERWIYLSDRRKYECYACNYQCSVTAGTILQDTKLPLSKWFLAAYFLLTTKKGISGPELARKLDIAQSTAWFLTQKILKVLGRDQALPLFGIIEVDETYIGGRKPGGKRGRGTTKELIVGMVEVQPGKLGRARFHHVPDATGVVLGATVRHEVQVGSIIRTDGHRSYNVLSAYDHQSIIQQDGREGHDMPAIHLLFSNLKRVIKGVHTHLAPNNFQPHLDLFRYRYDHRDDLWGGLYKGLLYLTQTKPANYRTLRLTATAK